MASQHLYGDAEIEYDDGVYTVIHELAVPLTTNALAGGFQSTHRRRRWEGWNASLREREVFTLDASVDEVVATIRFEDQPDALRDLLRAGLEQNATFIYRPTGPYGIEIDCLLVEIMGAGPDEIRIMPDRDRATLGEWEATVRLRAVNGDTFEGIL